jgi:hypothetical protein
MDVATSLAWLKHKVFDNKLASKNITNDYFFFTLDKSCHGQFNKR